MSATANGTVWVDEVVVGRSLIGPSNRIQTSLGWNRTSQRWFYSETRG